MWLEEYGRVFYKLLDIWWFLWFFGENIVICGWLKWIIRRLGMWMCVLGLKFELIECEMCDELFIYWSEEENVDLNV